jgi:hypothetical protein
MATQVPISTAESGIKRQAVGALLYVLRISGYIDGDGNMEDDERDDC